MFVLKSINTKNAVNWPFLRSAVLRLSAGKQSEQ